VSVSFGCETRRYRLSSLVCAVEGSELIERHRCLAVKQL
jgi:hypothetical protein